jgi:hypothetical protein
MLRGHTQYFWIDQMSINQNNEVEKGSQIPLMGDIFRSATFVLVWLGEEDYHSHITGKLVTEVERSGLEVRDVVKTIFEPSISVLHGPNGEMRIRQFSDTEIDAVSNFILRPWFGRLWTYQELLLGRDIGLWCGKTVITWESLVTTVLVAGAFGNVESYGSFVDGWGGRGAIIRNHYWPLPTILSRASARLSCSDVRDKVYALLSLQSPSDRLDIQVNYNLSPKEVFTMTAQAMVRKWNNLEILQYVQPPKQGDVPELFSWVPDWTRNTAPTTLMHHGLFSSDRGRMHLSESCFLRNDEILRARRKIVDTIEAPLFEQEFDTYKVIPFRMTTHVIKMVKQRMEELLKTINRNNFAERLKLRFSLDQPP